MPTVLSGSRLRERRRAPPKAGCPAASVWRRRKLPREAGLRADLTDPFTPSARSPAPQEPRPIAEGPGTCIGPYKLLQQIGEGGMGVVYMAEQERAGPAQGRAQDHQAGHGHAAGHRPVRGRAAGAGADGPPEHRQGPRRRHDRRPAGPTSSWSWCNGVPITEYCDDNQLTPRERLELFVPVCQAIQHAHQKGIIHRDIKPSNVLVTLYDGKPVPKVIDFGVAKAIEQRLTERTLFTQFGAIVGTLEYMSPEQAEMNALGRRHPQRHLLAGRAALRAADRHDAVRAAAAARGGLRRDAADHPRGGAAEAEHAAERLGRRLPSIAAAAQDRAGAGWRSWCAASSTGS